MKNHFLFRKNYSIDNPNFWENYNIIKPKTEIIDSTIKNKSANNLINLVIEKAIKANDNIKNGSYILHHKKYIDGKIETNSVDTCYFQKTIYGGYGSKIKVKNTETDYFFDGSISFSFNHLNKTYSKNERMLFHANPIYETRLFPAMPKSNEYLNNILKAAQYCPTKIEEQELFYVIEIIFPNNKIEEVKNYKEKIYIRKKDMLLTKIILEVKYAGDKLQKEYDINYININDLNENIFEMNGYLKKYIFVENQEQSEEEKITMEYLEERVKKRNDKNKNKKE